MEFRTFLSKISYLKISNHKSNFDGIAAQLKMVPNERLNFDFTKVNNPKEAAVLALFYPNAADETCFLLTLRANYKGTHSSQISFPGGKKEKLDKSLQNTALRETQEEVGIESDKIRIITALNKTYIPPSNFWVSPFIGITHNTPQFIKNYEVEKLLEITLSDLLNNSNVTSKILTTSYMDSISVPCFKFNKHIVWGATAMILSEIKELINHLFD